MTRQRWSMADWRLRLEIALWRYGLIWVLAAVLVLLALTLRAVVLPNAQAALDDAQAQWTQVRAQQVRQQGVVSAAVQPTTDDSVVADLVQASYAQAEVSEVLRRVAKIAHDQGLALAQSEYQSGTEGHGGLRQMQVTLPLRASYPQVRQFIEAVLRELPGVSVDQLLLKRETVAQSQAEIRLRLSLWVNPAKTRQVKP